MTLKYLTLQVTLPCSTSGCLVGQEKKGAKTRSHEST